jgi:hypothetical protein
MRAFFGFSSFAVQSLKILAYLACFYAGIFYDHLAAFWNAAKEIW